MSDIDIERLDVQALRDALVAYDRWGASTEAFYWYNASGPLVDAARFLVSLVDQGGELWTAKPCKHDARVWPKDDA